MMKMKRWELALVSGILFTIFFSAMPIRAQSQLADKITRLHVIANSDSAEDQALKLQVRDAVLEEAKAQGETLESSQIDDAFLARIQQAGQAEVERNGYDYQVKAERTNMYFTTRHYETFSLPAGYYDAVRVTIGQAAGKNWWCVMLPPLCTPSCSEEFEQTAKDSGLEPGEIRFMTRDGVEYAAKFKIVELWGEMVHAIRGE